jgi:uncharacterized protein (DUF302 family)
MSYYISRTIDVPFDLAVQRIRELLAQQGFGILTEIDVQATLKKKIDVTFRPYMILGACNPSFAHKALLEEIRIGVMLPCNVIIQQLMEGTTEVAAIDPVASMASIENDNLREIAMQIRVKLKMAIDML